MIIGFIGLGNMASAMVRGIAAAQLEGVALCGHNPHPDPHRARAAEADKLAFGEVESHLCFDFG